MVMELMDYVNPFESGAIIDVGSLLPLLNNSEHAAEELGTKPDL
jgi:hypothetical protein